MAGGEELSPASPPSGSKARAKTKLLLRFDCGKIGVVAVSAEREDTVNRVRELLAEAVGAPPEKLKLTFANKDLPLASVLKESKVTSVTKCKMTAKSGTVFNKKPDLASSAVPARLTLSRQTSKSSEHPQNDRMSVVSGVSEGRWSSGLYIRV